MLKNRSVVENIREVYDQMFSAEKKVADFVLKNPRQASTTNVSQLAQLSGVSEATVIRMAKHVGYQGFCQMRLKLSYDMGRTVLLDENTNRSQPGTVKALFETFTYDLMQIAEQLDTNLLLQCAQQLRKCRQVHLVAVGNTAPIATDLGFRLSRCGVRAFYSPTAEYFLSSINLAEKGDLVIAISKSGISKQVIQALDLAKQKKLRSIVVTSDASSPVAKLADYLLLCAREHPFYENRGASHLSELAINDVLLYFVQHGESIAKNIGEFDTNPPDEVELMLSESKL